MAPIAHRPELDAAYRRTVYRVAAPGGPIELAVDRPSPELDARLAAAGCRSWAWLTAVNPGSRRLESGANRARLARLDRELARCGLTAWPGVAIDPEGGWPEEPSRLVLGLDPGAAAVLAAALGQNAILVGETGAPPRLVWVAGAAP